MRHFKVSNRRRNVTEYHSLLSLVGMLSLGDGELDEIADLEVGETYNLDSNIDLERVE